MNRHDLRAALSNANVLAFLRTIREGESRQDEAAYRMRYGGIGSGPKYFDSFADHPRVFEMRPDGRRSSAAGAYQATATTWDEERAKWQFPDFSPGSQDEFAVARIVYRKALDAVREGRFEEACRLCRSEWTSLPGGDEENAATRRARETYLKWGGFLSASHVEPPLDTLATEHYGEAVTESTINPVPSADEQEARNMDPLTALSLISTVGPYIVGLIPQVKKLFDPSVPVAERNVGAAVAVLQTITDVAKTPDIHTAIANMKTDPVLRQEVTRAVVTHPEVVGLLEIGGGIAEARKANAEAAAHPLTRDRAFIFGVLFVAIVVMMLVDFLFIHPGNYDGNLRTQIVTAILALAAIVGAYYFGTSQGSQRKTDLLANQEK